ncbi:SpvB/TcaC N-terminal domain-containing protein [Streptomyces tubercidicus]|uniref:SpvB/TcaC N-terminal domain-containing protein n=1 Tax=Streptomyces tubercidicus TaxID=47759 RepID=UPI00368AB3EE
MAQQATMAAEPVADRTDGNRKITGTAATTLGSVSLPKGGGAVRGIGEKFAANPVTGTGSMTVPIATSTGRSGFGPQLALSYNSGSGNGPFGFGWSLALPSITRKTDKGLPRYRDADESDVYVLSGVEDLVPVLRPDGTRLVDDSSAPGYVVHRYRPRTEGLFARIERWTEVATGDIHWRSVSADNVTTLYGTSSGSRIARPADEQPSKDPPRVFSWLICETFDDKGNAVVYEYAAENADNVDLAPTSERNRRRTANRYLKRIKYGNRISRLLQPDLSQASWLFEVVFDYDEGHYETVDPDPALPPAEQHQFARASVSPAHPWAARPDPFSSHRAGFEVRTYRRCRRVLTFHHIPDLPTGEDGYEGLVRSTEFDYADLDYGQPVTVADELAHQGSTRIASFIRRVTQSGYVRDDTQPVVVRGGVPYATYLKQSLPPLELEYSKAVVQDEVHDVEAENPEALSVGSDDVYQWVDLHGEGLPGMLVEYGGSWLYHRNRSPLPDKGDGDGEGTESAAARFGPAERVATKPNLFLAGGRARLVDLAGDGHLDLVTLDGPMPGLYEHDDDEGWLPFRPFTSSLNLDFRDPNLRIVDLSGDGHSDVLITEDEAIVWHLSLAEEGFGPAARVTQPLVEEDGPRLVFADGTQSVHLADMCGDGLAGLVRVRNGEVCYWPSLGYGRFGAKVTMDNAPWFDAPEAFDQRRILLADIDGSGTTDIIYLDHDGASLYFNQAGNRLSDPYRLRGLPAAADGVSVTTADLLGNGTACLVWSSPLPADHRRPMRYVDLMGGNKPHLLTRAVNNLGAETKVHYAPSTKFYLADKRAGRPWVSRLPFPVHVVERVETYDHVSHNRFVTRYAYHHGHFDGEEREFGGFGSVEQQDTEHIDALSRSASFPVGDNVDASSHVPPVLTRTWFHTGVHVGGAHVSDFFAGLLNTTDKGEYYREPGLTDGQARALLLADTVLPPGLTTEEEREACRALRGSVLRQEVYALDGTGTKDYPFGHPYTVSEQNFTVRRLQPRAGNPYAVFLTHAREAITYEYERSPADPRVAHTITLAVDDFGNVRSSASIGYGRRQPDTSLPPADQARQAQILITCTENDVTNAIDSPSDHRTPLPSEARTYELTGLSLPAGRVRFAFDEIRDAVVTAAPLDYEARPTVGIRQKRPIEHVRTYYRRDDLTGPAQLAELQPLALPFQTYKLTFTPGLVAQVYGDRVTDTMLETDGRYTHTEADANWWAPLGRIFYSPDPADSPAQELAHARRHFFLPHRHRDPFHTAAVSTEGVVAYDTYDLLLQETRDALDNRVTVGERHTDPTLPPVRLTQDYRVLQPALAMDPNRNRSAVAFDALGMVAGTALMGKPEDVPARGDQLTAAFQANLTQAQTDAFLANPRGPLAATLLDAATSRVVHDLTAHWREPDPVRKPPTPIATLAREQHASEPTPAGLPRIHVSLAYVDGFGREIQHKIPAEPGPGPQRAADGTIIIGADGQPQPTAHDIDPRWVGSGWTVFNNKGKAVRQFEPFFTDTHRYESDVRIGVSPVLLYDPVGRVVATLRPDHNWEKTVFAPWRQESWNATDTVLVPDPAADADVGDHFRRLKPAAYLPTWHALRTDPAQAAVLAARYPDPDDRANETRAAQQTELHAATQTVTHADSLGRTIATVVHNRLRYSDTPATDPPVEEFQRTGVVLDIENNQREVTDAAGRVIIRYDHDMLGNPVHHAGMEAGERWMLYDVAGKPRYAWDSRDHHFRTGYDALQRPTHSFLREGAGAEQLVELSTYGESRPDPHLHNTRERMIEHRDQAGVLTTDDYDFKGNLLSGRRCLARDYKATLDWSSAPPLESETFASRTSYDALNRPTQLVTPHSDRPGTMINVIQPSYNEAKLLERVHAWLDLTAEPTSLLDPATVTAALPAVRDIDYDAKGQRTAIDYGNGVRTRYRYDPLTYRLTHLLTRRDPAAFPGDCPDMAPAGWPGCQVQNLHYTFDPAGNITHIRDTAQQTVFFRNRRVEPTAEYTYDAASRLIEATGREHLGLTSSVPNPPSPHSYNDVARIPVLHPGDGNAMGRYVERYVYDTVGNLLEMRHRGTDPAHAGWTRTYAYTETSQLDPTRLNNRLTGTTVDGLTETYSTAGDGYDAHGNLLRMPHLSILRWDEGDRLHMTQRQAMGSSDTDGVLHDGERTWYVYDSGGQRVRKVTELSGGQVKDERVYLGTFEIYRTHGVNPLVRETLHIMDDQRRIALVETRTEGSEPGVPRRRVRYQFDNHLGSAALELDDAAQIISYEEYAPYGSSTYQAARGTTEAAKRYRYTGKERDEESGFYYHGARYYAPWLGRWISVDPAGITDGPNTYLHSSDNPAKYIDSSGRQSTVPAGLISAEGEVSRVDKQGKLQTILRTREQALTGPLPAGVISAEGEVSKVDKQGKLQTILRTREQILSKQQDSTVPDSHPAPTPTPDTEITGGFGFVGIAVENKGAGGEALVLGGYDSRFGSYAGTLSAGGGAKHFDFAVHQTLHGVEKGGVMVGHERLHSFRSGHTETETIYIGEVEFPTIRGFEWGIGGFVNKDDPREVGFFGFGAVGPATFGGGVSIRLQKDYEQEQREILAKQGIELVRAPEGTSRPPSPFSVRAKFAAWLRAIGIDEAWMDRQIEEQNRVFERSGNDGMRLAGPPK